MTKSNRLKGNQLYEMYLLNPPPERGAAHVSAYWNGRRGVKVEYEKTSVAWWAYKAGKEFREAKRAG